MSAQDSQRVESLRAGADDVTDMVGRRQAICHGDAEDFERRDTDNSRQWLRCNLTLPFPFRVDKDDFFGFCTVQCQVVRPCPRLDVVDLGGPRVDVAGRNDEVGVVGELDELVSGGHRLQVARISHVRRRPDARPLDDACCDVLQRRRLTTVHSAV